MHLVVHLIHEYGLLTVAVIVGLECIGIPLPGETALLGAAIYAGTKHDLNIVEVILTAAAAAIAGRMIGYVIGREFGYWLLLRYGNYVRMTESKSNSASICFCGMAARSSLSRSSYRYCGHSRAFLPAQTSCRGAISCSRMSSAH